MIVTMSMIQARPSVQVVADQDLGGHTGHCLLYLVVVTRGQSDTGLVLTAGLGVTGAGGAEAGAGHGPLHGVRGVAGVRGGGGGGPLLGHPGTHTYICVHCAVLGVLVLAHISSTYFWKQFE